ncbi:rskn-2 [Symbiodinium microadriaticum]|nr:rskn-2 [Symbiodinium microadriaticum]CAE7878657.1 rskn-2 [Symbiodinium sp. KB8]
MHQHSDHHIPLLEPELYSKFGPEGLGDMQGFKGRRQQDVRLFIPHWLAASELVMPVGQGQEEVVEFASDTLILDRLLNGTITVNVKDVTGWSLGSASISAECKHSLYIHSGWSTGGGDLAGCHGCIR